MEGEITMNEGQPSGAILDHQSAPSMEDTVMKVGNDNVQPMDHLLNIDQQEKKKVDSQESKDVSNYFAEKPSESKATGEPTNTPNAAIGNPVNGNKAVDAGPDNSTESTEDPSQLAFIIPPSEITALSDKLDDGQNASAWTASLLVPKPNECGDDPSITSLVTTQDKFLVEDKPSMGEIGTYGIQQGNERQQNVSFASAPESQEATQQGKVERVEKNGTPLNASQPTKVDELKEHGNVAPATQASAQGKERQQTSSVASAGPSPGVNEQSKADRVEKTDMPLEISKSTNLDHLKEHGNVFAAHQASTQGKERQQSVGVAGADQSQGVTDRTPSKAGKLEKNEMPLNTSQPTKVERLKENGNTERQQSLGDVERPGHQRQGVTEQSKDNRANGEEENEMKTYHSTKVVNLKEKGNSERQRSLGVGAGQSLGVAQRGEAHKEEKSEMEISQSEKVDEFKDTGNTVSESQASGKEKERQQSLGVDGVGQSQVVVRGGKVNEMEIAQSTKVIDFDDNVNTERQQSIGVDSALQSQRVAEASKVDTETSQSTKADEVKENGNAVAESQGIDKKPEASTLELQREATAASSPLLAEDEEAMKTDEELPPYDFGSPRSDVDKADMPWSTSGLPYHLKFLAYMKPKEKPKSHGQVPSLSTKKAENNLHTLDIQKYVRGNEAPPVVPPPESGTEDFALMSGRRAEKTRRASLPQTAESNRQPSSQPQPSKQQQQEPQRRPSQPPASVPKQLPQQQPPQHKQSSQKPLPQQKQPSQKPPQQKQPPQQQAPKELSTLQPPQQQQTQQQPSQQSPVAQKPPPSNSNDDGRRPSSNYPVPTYPHDAPYCPPGQYRYPPVSTAAEKPIRRLAKIRPYANQAIPVSAEEIRNAIPKDASAVFHVMDRRVNLDAFDLDETSVDVKVPVYSLLRAWVQDDPYRQIPPPPVTLPSVLAGQNDDGPSSKRRRNEPADSNTSDHMEKKRKATADVTGYFRKTNSNTSHNNAAKLPSLDSLKLELVKDAREKKVMKRKGYKETLARTLKSLQARGIVTRK